MTRFSEQFRNFCQARINEDHAASDLFRKLAGGNFEVQIKVDKEGAEMIESDKGTMYEKDGVTFWDIRKPKMANSDECFWNDYKMDWAIHKYAEAVGSTGWDHVNQRSRWVAFDFDSIVGHQVGLTAAELDEIKKKLEPVPWVQIRKSTSGKGLHVYVHFDKHGFPATNHTKHTFLA